MANVKISNLTAASTPLAGTEVLPIVQSGATVKASIANVQTATYSGGTANGVAYLNGSKVLTTGSGLVFDGTNLGVGVTPSAWSGVKAVQFSNGAAVGSSSVYPATFSSNAYATGSGWTANYIANGYANLYAHNSGQHQWFNAASGTAGNAITFTQAMTLNTNGVLALQGASTSANGVGITFPATQSASSDANTLDDYEEGTWTPTIGGTSIVYTSGNVVGNYIKIGKYVAVWGQLYLSSGSPNATLGNLPFSGISNAPYAMTAQIYQVNGGVTYSASATNILGYVAGTSISIVTQGSAVGVGTPTLASNTQIYFSAYYQATA
jgi:hypothetical protein